VARRFKGFGDVGLHHQGDVAGDLAAAAGDDGEHGSRFRDAVAMGVPWRVRQRQLEFLRQSFRDGPSLVAKRGQRSGGAAELQRERLALQSLQALARTVQGRGIFRELEPERHRQRMLQPGAGNDGGVAMRSSQHREAGHGAVNIAKQCFDRRAQSEHHGRIDRILAGRAPMHIARGVRVHLGDAGGQRLDQGDREIAGSRCGLGQGGEIE
jgi:hypothetical protein